MSSTDKSRFGIIAAMQITFTCSNCESSFVADAGDAGSQVECSECGATLTVPRKGPGPGTTVGGFEIKRMLGKGGMGEVYLARQISMDRDIALKILPSSITAQPDVVDRFLREVRMAAKLDHPNIVTAHEAGEDGGVYYMAMAYINGEGLDEKLKRDGAMSEQAALKLIRKVAAGLDYAWEKHHILHRDIKPANVMLDEDGEPRLTDMGLSKSTDDVGGMTMSGTVMGTPNYMSPEQAEGKSEMDFRSDIYSLGATLYHMLAGKMPFEGTSVMDTLRKQISESLPDPRESNPDVSEACVSLLEIMLAKSPDGRHPSWNALIADINAVLGGHPLSQAAPAASILLRADAARKGHGDRKIVVGQSTIAKLHNVSHQAAEHKSPKSKASLVAAAVVGVFVVVAGIVVLVGAKSGKKSAAPPAVSSEVEIAQREQAAEDAARRQEAEAAAKKRKAKEETARLLAAEEAAKKRKAQETARKEGISRVLVELKSKAETLGTQGKVDEAKALLKNYSGLYAAETAAERAKLVKTHEEAAATAAVSERVAEERLTQLREVIADHLLKHDFAAARRAVDETGVEASLRSRKDWKEIKDLTEKASQMPSIILAAYKSHKGKDTTVYFRKGMEKLRITQAGPEGVMAKRSIVTQGKVVGSSARSFGYRDLSVREKMIRLGKEQTPEKDIMRGLLAWESKRPEAAEKLFVRSDSELGRILNERMAQLLMQQKDAVVAGKKARREAVAARAFQELLAAAGLAKAEKNPEKLKLVVRKKRFTESEIARAGKCLKSFRQQHADTDYAGDYAAVLDTFARIRPNMPLYVTQDVLDAALARLQKANPGSVSWKEAKIEEDGIVLDFSGQGMLIDISALHGLPIKSLNLNLTAVKDLTPLQGMPLTRLELMYLNSAQHDLSPLSGMPLRRLGLRSRGANGPRALNLRPLQGMSLEHLDLSGDNGSAGDLSPLLGMPLKHLNLQFWRGLHDISPLENMPLEYLNIVRTGVKDITPIQGSKTLKQLVR